MGWLWGVLVLGSLAWASFYFLSQARLAQEQVAARDAQLKRERQALDTVTRLATSVLDADSPVNSFAAGLCVHVRAVLKASGAAVFLREGGELVGCHVDGYFPILRSVGQYTGKLLTNPHHNTRLVQSIRLSCSHPGLADLLSVGHTCHYHGERPGWLPEAEVREFEDLVAVPLGHGKDVYGLLLISQARGRDHLPEDTDLQLQATCRIAAVALEGLNLRQNLLAERRQAHQAEMRGMQRIVRGIVHNLGNATAVLQLAEQELSALLRQKCQPTSAFLSHECLPALRRSLATLPPPAAAAPEAAAEPPPGELLAAVEEVGTHLDQNLSEAAEVLDTFSRRVAQISALVQLQQSNLDELGTEDVVNLAQVLAGDVQAMLASEHCQAPTMSMPAEPCPVLIDKAMLAHLLVSYLNTAAGAAGTCVAMVLTPADQHYVLRILVQDPAPDSVASASDFEQELRVFLTRYGGGATVTSQGQSQELVLTLPKLPASSPA